MRMEKKNADNKKSKKKKKRNVDGKKNNNKINKQTKERNLSFESLSHVWTLHLHTERDANNSQSYFVPCNSFH